MKQRITIENSAGKEFRVTRLEFADRWVLNAQIDRLYWKLPFNSSDETCDQVLRQSAGVKRAIREMAYKVFDEIYNKEQKDKEKHSRKLRR